MKKAFLLLRNNICSYCRISISEPSTNTRMSMNIRAIILPDGICGNLSIKKPLKSGFNYDFCGLTGIELL
ncbi:MAG: hypothetical protein OCD00_16670 [Colwellia sp.]